jgi:hypothetical protein
MNQQTKNQTWKVVASIAVVGVMCVLATGTSGSDEEGEEEGSSSDTEGAHAIGTAIENGPTTVTVTEVTTAERVGNEIFNETAAASAIFVVVRFTEKNNSNETLTVLGTPFKLVDAQGRRFEPSSRAESAFALAEGIEIIPQIQPGIDSRGVAAFEVPREAATGNVTLEFTERGFLGSSIERIAVTLPALPAAGATPPEGATPVMQ